MPQYTIPYALERLNRNADFCQMRLDMTDDSPKNFEYLTHYGLQRLAYRGVLIEELVKIREAMNHIHTHPHLAFAILEAEDKAWEEQQKENRRKEQLAQEEKRKIQREKNVKTQTEQLIVSINAYILESNNPARNHCLLQISNYLSKRKNKFAFFTSADENIDQIEKRIHFVSRLFTLIKNENLKAQISLLQEENICHFKGWITKEFYSLLTQYKSQLIMAPKDKATIGIELLELKPRFV